MRAIKIGVVVALFAVVAIAFLLGLMWLDHNRETTLPTPTGPFAVGRTTYVWSDPAHLDPTAPQPGRRQVALTAQYISTFFDVYPKGAPAPQLQSQPEYPEIEYVH